MAGLLAAFGAQPGLKNGKGQSALDIIHSHPPQKKDEFMKLFKSERKALWKKIFFKLSSVPLIFWFENYVYIKTILSPWYAV